MADNMRTVTLADSDHELIRAHILNGDVKVSIVNHVADTLLTVVFTKEQMEKLIDAYSEAKG